jgi:molybdate transport system substrate-binding protein
MEEYVIGLPGRFALLAALALAQSAPAAAAELRLYSSVGMRGALEQLVPQFQEASGQTLAITWGTAAMLTKRIAAGEPVDVAVLTRGNIDSLVNAGKIAADSAVTLANSSIAVAVKMGEAKPDIATADLFKQALLNAKSVAYSNPASGGASGVYFAKLLERLGIADDVKPKSKFPPPGGNAASLLISGEAQLAIQQKPELMEVPGVDVVGPLPGELGHVTAFAAGIAADSKNADAAKAFIKFLQSPKAAAVLKAKGFDPS